MIFFRCFHVRCRSTTLFRIVVVPVDGIFFVCCCAIFSMLTSIFVANQPETVLCVCIYIIYEFREQNLFASFDNLYSVQRFCCRSFFLLFFGNSFSMHEKWPEPFICVFFFISLRSSSFLILFLGIWNAKLRAE